MTLQQWLEKENMRPGKFAKLIPCSAPYPGMIMRGDAKPSYKMAVRIEQITGGEVPRTNWFPADGEIDFTPGIIKKHYE